MKKTNKRLVQKAKELEKYLNNPNKAIKREHVKPVTIKPGHAQARDCSAENWFK